MVSWYFFGPTQGSYFVIAIVTTDDPIKGSPGREVHALNDQGLAGVKWSLQQSGSWMRARNVNLG